MLYTALTLIGTILFLTFVSCYVVLRIAVPKGPLRTVMLLFVALTPFVAIPAFLKALIFGTKPMRYNAELGAIEDEIEQERVQIFGGKAMHPSISQRWRASYVYAIEKSAMAAAKIDPALSASLCGLAR
jgi:hypothetical protein